MSDNSKPAFPSPGGAHSGLSKREYFAAHAPEMPKWFSEASTYRSSTSEKLALIVEWRWAYADAMIAARGVSDE